MTRFRKTGTSTAVHQRSKTGDIVEAYRTEGGCGKGQNNLFREGGKAPLPLQRVSRPFSLGPGPARAPLMEAEGYSRSFCFFSTNVVFLLLNMCFMCFLEKVNLGQDFSPIPPPFWGLTRWGPTASGLQSLGLQSRATVF